MGVAVTIFTNTRVIDVVEGVAKPLGAVRVGEDGTIAEISGTTSFSKRGASDEIIDLDGRFLFPGLISCHTHLSVVFPFSLTDPEENPAVTAYRSAQRASDALLSGVTTIRSVHEQNQADLMLRKAFAAGWIKAPRIFGAGRAISTPNGHGRGSACSYAKDFEGFYQAALDELNAGADHIKIFITGGLAHAGESPDIPEMSDDEIRGVVKAATEHDTYVVAHAGESKAIQQALRLGVRSFEHGYVMDQETVDQMAAKDVFYSPTLCVTRSESWMRAKGFEEPSIQNALKASERHLESVKLAIKANIKMTNGTDYPPGDLVDGVPAALHELFLMHQAGLSTLKSLQSITSMAAKLIKQENFLGQIREGFAGDFIATRGNPLDDPEHLREIDLVVQSGAVIRNSL
ncbi:MAG: amidohydrolase family protein [Actinobacteria bacterium]|nr:amidohydrolase family protein [Actinomycetota bacterium]